MPKYPKIALVTAGHEGRVHLQSGVVENLANALQGEIGNDDVCIIHTGLLNWQRNLTFASTIHRDRATWRYRQSTARLTTYFRSRNRDAKLKRCVAGVGDEFTIHVRGIYRPSAIPYAPFIDTTQQYAREAWPDWVRCETGFARSLRSEQLFYRNADLLFVSGSHLVSTLVEFYGVRPDRIVVVGGGTNHFGGVKGGSTPNIQPEPRILFIAKSARMKGLDTLLSAFQVVRRIFPAATLTVVGPHEPTLLPGVEFVGPIWNREELARLLMQSTVLCHPARYESYGLVLQEAMSLGVPCIATSVGGIPEVLGYGQRGLLVPPERPDSLAAAILRLQRSPELAQLLARQGFEFATVTMTWGIVARRILSAVAGL